MNGAEDGQRGTTTGGSKAVQLLSRRSFLGVALAGAAAGAWFLIGRKANTVGGSAQGSGFGAGTYGSGRYGRNSDRYGAVLPLVQR